VILWVPGDLTTNERQIALLISAPIGSLVFDWQGKESDDAVCGGHDWVANALQAEPRQDAKIVDNSFGRGRVDALNSSEMEFHVAGELRAITTPLVDRVSLAAYESRHPLEDRVIFRKEEGVQSHQWHRQGG